MMMKTSDRVLADDDAHIRRVMSGDRDPDDPSDEELIAMNEELTEMFREHDPEDSTADRMLKLGWRVYSNG